MLPVQLQLHRHQVDLPAFQPATLGRDGFTNMGSMAAFVEARSGLYMPLQLTEVTATSTRASQSVIRLQPV